MFFKNPFFLFFRTKTTCIFEISLCTLDMTTLCQSSPKPTQIHTNHTHTPSPKPVESLRPKRLTLATSSRQSALHWHGQAILCRGFPVPGSYSKNPLTCPHKDHTHRVCPLNALGTIALDHLEDFFTFWSQQYNSLRPQSTPLALNPLEVSLIPSLSAKLFSLLVSNLILGLLIRRSSPKAYWSTKITKP